ncbi:MAG: hypothetical protein ACW964_10535 [Candidatus Hodarchaeales archaeon]
MVENLLSSLRADELALQPLNEKYYKTQILQNANENQKSND